MRSRKMLSGAAPVMTALLAFSPIAIEADYPDWNIICHVGTGQVLRFAALTPAAQAPVAHCGAVPSRFHELHSVGGDGDTTVDLSIGYDPDTDRLCYVTPSLPEAPVIRVGVGDKLTVNLTNTLHNTGRGHEMNCPIDVFGGEQIVPAVAVLPGTTRTGRQVLPADGQRGASGGRHQQSACAWHVRLAAPVQR